MSIEVGRGRILLAFLCAGTAVAAGVSASAVVHGLIAGDRRAVDMAVAIPIFGLPFIAVTVLAGFLAYCGLRLVGRVSGRSAMAAGSLVGAAAALLLRVPYLPPWVAAFIGAAAGWLWWQVVQDAIEPRVT